MQKLELKPLKDDPYVKIGLLYEELISLLSQNYGVNVSCFNNGQLRSCGICALDITKLLHELHVDIYGSGSPILRIYSKKFIYGARSSGRVQFELMEKQEEYGRMIEEQRLNGFFLDKKGGLSKANPVRIFNAIYSSGGEILVRQLIEKLRIDSSYSNNIKRVLEPMKTARQIKMNGEMIQLSEWMKETWNDVNLDAWKRLKSSPFYVRLLYLNSYHIEKMEKKA